jgi:hypothetical protein
MVDASALCGWGGLKIDSQAAARRLPTADYRCRLSASSTKLQLAQGMGMLHEAQGLTFEAAIIGVALGSALQKSVTVSTKPSSGCNSNAQIYSLPSLT